MAQVDTDKAAINAFQTRVRQLMYEFEKVRSERDELLSRIDEKDGEMKELQAQIRQLEQQCKSLKIAKMLEINDGDVESAKKRIDSLIRQVDRCIALLNL